MPAPNEKDMAAQLAKAMDLDTEAAADQGGAQPLQRSMFPWVVLQDQMDSEHPEMQHLDTTYAYEVICHYGVPEVVFDEFMKKEMGESESCWSLPFTLLLVISYTGMMVSHQDSVLVHSVEHSVVDVVEEKMNFAYSSPWIGHKTIYDINSITDWYSWMNRGLIPTIFPEAPLRSEGFDAEDLPEDIQEKLQEENDAYPTPKYTRIIERYNFLVGGVMLRQERSQSDADGDCPTMTELLNFYDRPCSRGLRYELEPDPFHARFTSNPERVQWLPAYRNTSAIHQILKDMEMNNWLDTYTQKVEIGLPIYNGEHGIHTLVTINFFFPRTGHIWKLIIPSSVFAEQFAGGTMVYVFDITWLYCLVHIVATEIKEIVQETRRSGCNKDCRGKYIGLWNTVDWISVFTGIAFIIFFFIGTKIINAYNDCLVDLGHMTPEALGLAWESPNLQYDIKTDECYGSLENAVWYMNFVRIVFAAYPFVIGLRLLKAFAAQPRLALLTRTIWFAGQDLLHFLFVFLSIFCTFITAAMLLFGRYIDDFATVFRACTTVMRVMLGDFDWPALSYTGRLEAFIWFVLFILIVVMLLLNMIMAIIMDAYENVKEQMDNADTLFTEFKQAYNRWIGTKRGDLVSMAEVLRGVTSNQKDMKVMYNSGDSEAKKQMTEMAGDEIRMSMAQAKVEPFLDLKGDLRVVNVEFLRNSVLKMRTEQARTLLEAALMAYYNDNKVGQHFEEMTRMMYEMTAEIKNCAKALRASATAEDISSDSEEETALEDLDNLKKQEKDNIALFKSELRACEEELSHAKLWIGTELAFGEEVTTQHDHDKDDDTDVSSASSIPSEKTQQQQSEVEELARQVREANLRTKRELDEISLLEPRLLQASEDTADAAAKFQKLREEFLVLAQSRKLTREENIRASQEEEEVKAARDETFESARLLSEENDKMKATLAELATRRKKNVVHHGDDTALQNLLLQIEAEEQHAEYVDGLKAKAYAKLIHNINAIEDGSGGRILEVRDFCGAARKRLQSQPLRAMENAHASVLLDTIDSGRSNGMSNGMSNDMEIAIEARIDTINGYHVGRSAGSNSSDVDTEVSM